MSMPRDRQAQRRRKLSPSVEAMEGRALLSGFAARLDLSRLAAAVRPLPSGLGRAKIDPVAVGVITEALMGRGPAAEFGSLVRSQIRSVPSVLSGFLRGTRTEYTAPGIAVKLPKWQELYTGPHYDHLTATAAGAVLQPDGSLLLGAVMRGLFDEQTTSQVVFGIDRGAGKREGPLFANRPGITPDALVEITIGASGQNATGVVRDLTDDSTRPIDPARIRVVGATVRVSVDPSLLPPKGKKPSQYRFSTWTRHETGGGVESVGSFVAERTMVVVGAPPRRR